MSTMPTLPLIHSNHTPRPSHNHSNTILATHSTPNPSRQHTQQHRLYQHPVTTPTTIDSTSQVTNILSMSVICFHTIHDKSGHNNPSAHSIFATKAWIRLVVGPRQHAKLEGLGGKSLSPLVDLLKYFHFKTKADHRPLPQKRVETRKLTGNYGPPVIIYIYVCILESKISSNGPIGCSPPSCLSLF